MGITKHVIKVSDLVTCTVWQSDDGTIERIHFMSDDGIGCPVGSLMDADMSRPSPQSDSTMHLNLMEKWKRYQR